MSLQYLFNNTFRLEKLTVAQNTATGEQGGTWSIEEENVPCRIQDLNRSSTSHRRLTLKYNKASHALYTNWREVDPLRHRVITDGITYAITATRDFGCAKRIICIYLERVR